MLLSEIDSHSDDPERRAVPITKKSTVAPHPSLSCDGLQSVFGDGLIYIASEEGREVGTCTIIDVDAF
nr:hypothetical protein SHINE37_70043 [Rhizobiaceae bacterium]